MKPAVRSAESPFLVEVQEYRSRRSAAERLFQGLLPQDPVSPGNRSQCHFWAATGRFRPPGTPYAAVRTSSRGTASSPAPATPNGLAAPTKLLQALRAAPAPS